MASANYFIQHYVIDQASLRNLLQRNLSNVLLPRVDSANQLPLPSLEHPLCALAPSICPKWRLFAHNTNVKYSPTQSRGAASQRIYFCSKYAFLENTKPQGLFLSLFRLGLFTYSTNSYNVVTTYCLNCQETY